MLEACTEDNSNPNIQHLWRQCHEQEEHKNATDIPSPLLYFLQLTVYYTQREGELNYLSW